MKHDFRNMARMSQETAPAQGMRTIDRALSLLGIVCAAGEVSLADAARQTTLSPSTALRLLRALEAHEFVRRDAAGLFSPGPHLVQLGAAALSNDALITQARDAMRRVAESTTESCYLSVFAAGHNAMHLAIVEGTQSVRHVGWAGRTIPTEGTAVGRVLLGETGDTGYIVVSEGAEKDVTAISTAIRAGDRIVATLSCLVPSYRLADPSRIAAIGEQLVAQAATVFARESEGVTS
jgi:IclR family transcriptional regulator, acetate operon repressor